MNDLDKDELIAKLKEETARLRVQLREVSERLSVEGGKFRTNLRDETANGKWRENLELHKGWVVVGVIVVVAILAVAFNS